MNEEQKELENFMNKKNAEARGEVQIEVEDEEDKIKERERAINQEAGEGDTRAAKALTKLRRILNMMLVIPLIIVIIALIGYILLRILPSIIQFLRNLFIKIITQNSRNF